MPEEWRSIDGEVLSNWRKFDSGHYKFMSMRVVHVISADMGVRFILLHQLLFLKSKGYEVTAVCSSGKWVKEIEDFGIHVKTIELTRSISVCKGLLSIWRLFLYFRSENFDIAHTHTPSAGFIGRIAARMAGIPLIVHTNPGFYFHENSGFFSRRFYVLLEKIAAWCCDLILSQNSEDVKAAIREGICRASKIRRLGNGIDVSRFDPDQYLYDRIVAKKKELGIPPASRVVGIVARLVREKGIVEFLQAAHIVGEAIPDVKFVAVGPIEPGKSDQIQPGIVKQFGLENHVILIPEMRTDISDVLALMDVVTLPSYREGMPRLPMEAGLMRKPVVTTNIRGCREVIDNGRTGILIPVRDSVALSEAIIYLLENPEKARQMGIAAQSRIKMLFDERQMFERIISAYREIGPAKGVHGTYLQRNDI